MLEDKDLDALADRLRDKVTPATNIIAGGGGDLGRPSWRACLSICLVVAILAFAGGIAVDHIWNVSDLKAALAASEANLKNEKAKPPVKIPVEIEGKGTNTIAYVDRPIYIDPATGKPAIDPKTGQPIKDPADLVANQSKADFKMALIGATGQRKDFTFNKKPTERFIFDQNRLEWTTAWELNGTIDARDMMEEYARARIAAERSKGGANLDIVDRGIIAGAEINITKRWGLHGTFGVIDGKPIKGGGVKYNF